MINRAAEEFMCIPCLAKHFGATETRVRELIEEYRAYGCTLFAKKE
jgi:biotin operon repressor